MIDEQYELFTIANRTWRVITTRGRDDHQMPTMRMSLATTDEEFTRDSKTTIEYYSDYFTIDPVVAKDQYVRECMSFCQAIYDNDEEFTEPEHWHVRQVDRQDDRLIMHRFSGIPLPYFWRLWRRPLVPQNITVESADISSALMKFTYFEEEDPLMSMSFECYLDWDGLFDNLKDKHAKRRINEWWKTMSGSLYLFSDYDSVFESNQDEIAYIADFA